MVEDTGVAQAHAAKTTIEFIAMTNLVSTFGAFDRSIDKLKHQTFIPGLLGNQAPRQYAERDDAGTADSV